MAKFMQTMAVIILILATIGSFVMGNTFGMPTLYGERTYNWTVAISGLLASAISFGILYSIGCILELLETIQHQLRRNDQMPELLKEVVSVLSKTNQGQPESTASKDCSPENSSSPLRSVTRPADKLPAWRTHTSAIHKNNYNKMRCPKCDMSQSASLSFCTYCGEKF